MKKLTLKQYLKENNIKYKDIKSISYTTLRNVIRWHHDWQYNERYKGRLPYFPTVNTIISLSWELNLSYVDLEKLIINQHKSNKKKSL